MRKSCFFASIISFILFFHASSANQLRQPLPASRHTKSEVIKYLGRYGHLRQTNALSASVDDTSYAQAIRSLQRFGGLKETGVLDADTSKLLNTPRCGMPDIHTQGTSSSLDLKRRRRRYILSPEGLRWSSGFLKYFIGSTPAYSISAQVVASRVSQAFQAWTSVVSSSQLSVTPSASSDDADINIGFFSKDHGDGVPFDGLGGVLAHTFFPRVGRVHFDNDEMWTDGPQDPKQQLSNATYFYQAALHELGHSLGLDHSTVASAVMAPYYYYSPNIALTSDDIQGIQALFGVNPCLSNPCQNSGTCAQSSSSFTCTCTTGWIGSTCATADACISNPCQNGGRCVQSSSSSFYTCSCTTGWTGNTCTIATSNPCANNPCNNGGTCIPSGSPFTCTCTTGWSGNTCSTANLCANRPCQNGGTCVQTGSSYTCSCTTGWSGSTCTYNPCTNNPCENGGTCSVSGSSFTCSCATGWSGFTCQTLLSNPCMNNPCQHGGTCIPIGSFFLCACTPAWIGSTCMTANTCANNPCLHGGKCTPSPSGASFSCYCFSGWTGTTCASLWKPPGR